MIVDTIAALGTDGPLAKRSEGRFRFLCPHCREMLATVNTRNNLVHCFGCAKYLNNIDLLIPWATTSSPPSASWCGCTSGTVPGCRALTPPLHRKSDTTSSTQLPASHPHASSSSPDQQRRTSRLQIAQ
ncbi:MAG: hypothetical protein U0796_18965 [Gemmatales bacterium]